MIFNHSNCKIKEIIPKVFLVKFSKQYDMTYTLVRFQEYYENPRFKGYVVDLEELHEDFFKFESGKLDYYDMTTGMNFNSKCISPFVNNCLLPLRSREIDFIRYFQEETLKPFDADFYIIATFKSKKKEDNSINHELAHALFYTNQFYKEEAIKILDAHNKKLKLFYKLLKKMNYHFDLWADECQAYLLEDKAGIKRICKKRISKEEMERLLENTIQPRIEMRRLFKKHMKGVKK